MLRTIVIGTLLMGPAPVEPAELGRGPIRDPVRVVTTLPIYAELVREIGRFRDMDYSYRRIKGEISDLMGIQVSHMKIQRIIQKYHSFQSQM